MWSGAGEGTASADAIPGPSLATTAPKRQGCWSSSLHDPQGPNAIVPSSSTRNECSSNHTPVASTQTFVHLFGTV